MRETARQTRLPALRPAMSSKQNRLHREILTVDHMIGIFCTGSHDGEEGPCNHCRQLLEQVKKAVDLCPYKEDKPVCGRCATYCYDPAVAQQLHSVMHYAGPRMMVRHPVLAFLHLVDALRSAHSGRIKYDVPAPTATTTDSR